MLVGVVALDEGDDDNVGCNDDEDVDDEDVDEEDPERAGRQIVDEDVRVGIDGCGVNGGFVVGGHGVGLSFNVGLDEVIRWA